MNTPCNKRFASDSALFVSRGRSCFAFRQRLSDSLDDVLQLSPEFVEALALLLGGQLATNGLTNTMGSLGTRFRMSLIGDQSLSGPESRSWKCRDL